MNQGFIKLHRKIMDSPLWQSCKPERKTILITILLKANHKEKTIILDSTREKITLLPGQFVTSRSKLAKECGKGISEQMIRSALDYFEKHDFLTKQSTSKSTNGYTLITIKNWGLYQADDRNQPSKQPRNQPSTNQAPTTNKNEKNEKKDIYNKIQQEFNSTCKGLPSIKKISDAREKAIDARIKEHNLEIVLEVFKIASKSSYLNGYNKRNWKANFDWIMNPNNFLKVLEGNYNSNLKVHNPAEEKTNLEIIDGYEYETV